jgi:HEAT repeat protein/predicted phosphodiesterase
MAKTTGRFVCSIALLVLLAGCAGEDPQIVEGPYVTPDGPTAVLVSWRTALPGDSWVEYGPTPRYGERLGVETETTDHAVRLEGLKQGRRYYYRVTSKGSRFDGSFTAGIRFSKGPYSQAVQSSGAVVMWETEPSVDGGLIFQVADESADTAVSSGQNGIRKATLDGLEAGTVYRCRALVDGLTSPELRFRTPSPSDTTVTFIVYGDSRNADASAHRALVDQMAARPVDLVLHSGDFVYDGNIEAQWEPMFFAPVRKLGLKAPIYPAPGNHEEDAAAYYRHFSVPDNGSATRPQAWYAIDYGPAHFVVLDTNPESGRFAAGTEQLRWLESDLGATSARWKIVMFHHPLYSKARHSSNIELRKALMPVFERHKVDLIFTGHDHGYQRSWPVEDERRSDDGVVHVVSAGGGAELYPAGRESWTAVSQSVHHYCEIEIRGSRLDMNVVDIQGHSVDALTIQKDRTVYTDWIRAARGEKAGHKAEAIGLLGRTGRLDALGAVLASAADPGEQVRRAVAEALARIGSPEGRAALKTLSGSEDTETRRWAVRGVIDIGGDGAAEICIGRLGDTDPEVRLLAATGLARQPSRDAAGPLARASRDTHSEVRVAALGALTVTPAAEADAALLGGLGDRVDAVRRCAFEGIRQRELVAEAAPILIELLPGEAVGMRRDIVRALGEAGGSDALPVLRARVLDEDVPTSQIAIRALAGLRDAGAVENLIGALDSENKGVRTYVTRALVVITGERPGEGRADDWRRWWRDRRAVPQQ